MAETQVLGTTESCWAGGLASLTSLTQLGWSTCFMSATCRNRIGVADEHYSLSHTRVHKYAFIHRIHTPHASYTNKHDNMNTQETFSNAHSPRDSFTHIRPLKKRLSQTFTLLRPVPCRAAPRLCLDSVVPNPSPPSGPRDDFVFEPSRQQQASPHIQIRTHRKVFLRTSDFRRFSLDFSLLMILIA